MSRADGAPGRVAPERYRRLDLEAHALLADVPLHDVWHVGLPGGGRGRSVADVRELMRVERLLRSNPAVSFLFRLRIRLGALFGWDAAVPEPTQGAEGRPSRVPSELLARSVLPPGSEDGPFVLLYATEREAVSEVRNRTVHAFSVLILEPAAAGYDLFWAIHVAPVGRITRFYMALIDPFRRFVIYPAVLRHVRRAWVAAHGGLEGSAP